MVSLSLLVRPAPLVRGQVISSSVVTSLTRLLEEEVVLTNSLHVLKVGIVSTNTQSNHLALRIVAVEFRGSLEPAEDGGVQVGDLLITEDVDVAAHGEVDDVVDGEIGMEEDVAGQVPSDDGGDDDEHDGVGEDFPVEEMGLQLGVVGNLEPVRALTTGVAGEEGVGTTVEVVPAEAVEPVHVLVGEAFTPSGGGTVVDHTEPRVTGGLLEVVRGLGLEDTTGTHTFLPATDTEILTSAAEHSFFLFTELFF